MNENTINNDVTIAGSESVLASRYRIIKQLGQGGMGSVWLAEDTQLDNKLFAIKMLPSILVSNKRAYNQLKSEALVAMKLVHPNIVQIRAFEENNGNPFLVMDYIDGETLDDWLGDRGRELGVREEEVVKLLKPIAEALDYAHIEGVVHRDVKPANVMIRKDGRPFIMDFGIAREIQETLTRVTGKLSSGTLLYMSPEQLNGASPKLAQDVYSFAAMVYECLKGEPPFCRGAIEDQIKNKTPEVLGDYITVASSVMAGLAKKPENRPKTCADVLKVNSNTFQSFGKNWEGERPREPQSEQTVRATSSGKAFGKIAAVGLLVLGLAGGVWYWQDAKAKEEARIVAEQKAEAERKAAEEARRIAEEKAKKEKVEAERRQKEEAEREAEARVADIMVEATVKKNQLLRIDDADGFQDRKTILSDLLTKATAFGKAKQWDKAALNFTNYVEGCNKLIALDGERKAAKEKQSAALVSQRQAANAESSKYASVRWGVASDVMKKASEHFSQMEFSEAKGFYESAANQFKLCIREAKNERERQVFETLATNPGKVLKKDLFTPKLKEYEWICTEISRVQGELSALLRTFTEEHPEVRAKRMKLNELLEQFVTRMEKEGLGDKARKALNKSVSNKSVSKVQLWDGGPYWATKNIGAEKPEDPGYYFWWGDTIGYKREGDKWVASDGSNSNFEFRNFNTPTDGKSVSDLRSEGWITADGVLSPQHDAAQKHWGGDWRMPTKKELDDLVNKCDWRGAQVNGVDGYVVRGKGEYSSKSIFLPCAGLGDGTSRFNAGSCGYYWSSGPRSGGSYSWSHYFSSCSHDTGYGYRFYGQSVRPLQGFTK